MATNFSTQFPDRPQCFGLSAFQDNSTCTTPTPVMIDFLNITQAWYYNQVYCLNPPQDSCAFGYCPNPDIASPAVRVSTYISSVCLAALILYSPDDIVGAFYAQILAVYSLVISVAIAIGSQNLTRLHAVFAVSVAGSPLSIYLVLYAIRAMFFPSRVNRLRVAFGEGQLLNRIMVLLMVPIWMGLLIFISLPSKAKFFQQIACDAQFNNHLVRHFFYGPLNLLYGRPPWQVAVILLPIVGTATMWPIAIFRIRHVIWCKRNNAFPWRRIWRKTVDTYPFIQFCTVIVVPFGVWIATLETGSSFSQEYFMPTYGQLLSIFVAVPPVIQCFFILPRIGPWIADLTWVRYITGRRFARYLNPKHDPSLNRQSMASMASLDSYKTMYDPEEAASLTGKKGHPRQESMLSEKQSLHDQA